MTERYAELSTLDTTALSDMIRDKLADEIQLALENKRVGRQFVDVVDITNQSRNTVDFLERERLYRGARKVGEGKKIPTEEPAWSEKLSIGVEKFGVGGKFTAEAIADAREDIVQDSKDEMAIALADREDFEILESMFSATEATETVTSTSQNWVPLSNSPLVSIEAATQDGSGTDWGEVDSRNANVYMGLRNIGVDVDCDFRYTYEDGAIDSINTDSSGTFQLSDLQKARNKIIADGYEPDVFLIHDSGVADFLESSNFIDASKYGSDEPLLNGEIGKIYGMKVVLITTIAEDAALLFDSEARPFKFVEKQGVEVDTDEDVSKQVLEVYATQRYGVGNIKKDAVCAIHSGT